MSSTDFAKNNQLCVYYQGQVLRSESWFVVAVLKSWEHVVFDRTVDVERSIFEFFVPAAMEPEFLAVMLQLTTQGLVSNLHKLENRLADPLAVV